jgi:sugar phosphate isomerase/epimerase
MDHNQIALQLYTVREHTAQDMRGTLRTLAGMGYRAVEFAGYGGVPTGELRALLDELGMTAPCAHVSLQDLQTEPERIFGDLHTLGCAFAVVPWVTEEYRTATGVQQLAGALNALAARSRDEGLRFAYHNHAFEFASLDGSTMWERLVETTDPELVLFELDVYWTQHGGGDPLALLRKYGARLPLLHIKDMSADQPPHDAPVGEGVLDWGPLLAAGRAAGTEWYIIEQDTPQQPLPDVERSLHNLTALLAQSAAH